MYAYQIDKSLKASKRNATIILDREQCTVDIREHHQSVNAKPVSKRKGTITFNGIPDRSGRIEKQVICVHALLESSLYTWVQLKMKRGTNAVLSVAAMVIKKNCTTNSECQFWKTPMTALSLLEEDLGDVTADTYFWMIMSTYVERRSSQSICTCSPHMNEKSNDCSI